MKSMYRLRMVGLLVLVLFVVALVVPIAAAASVAGRRNTAIGLTGAAVYSAVRHKPGPAIVLGAGAAYAWKRHSDARKHVAYNRGYHKGYYRGYHKGYTRGRGLAYGRRHRR